MAKCNACGKFMSSAEGVACPKCRKQTHRACVNIPEGAKIQASWLCPECKLLTPRLIDSNTPVKGSSSVYLTEEKPQESQHCIEQDKTEQSHETELAREIRILRQEMRETRDEFRSLRQDLSDVRHLIKSCEERVDTLERKLETINDTCPGHEALETKIQNFETIIVELKNDINDREQQLLLTDIEVAGIPEESEENVIHIITACATKLGVRIEERDIVNCTRVGRLRSSSGEQNNSLRPRPIAVRLARRHTRDALLRAARVRRSLTTEGLGLRATSQPFFVNEHLTKHNRAIFFKARELGRRLGWRYIWTKDGKIYARRDHGSMAHRIRNTIDIDRVFGKDLVGSTDTNPKHIN